MAEQEPLSLDELRWRCDTERFSFETTEDLEAHDDIVGQDRAVEAIEFGMGIDKDGYNLFAHGPSGLGKHDTVERFLKKRAAEDETPPDWCYVHNFEVSNEPQVLQLPAGRGCELREDMESLIEELKAVIPAAFESEDYQTRRQAIDEEFQEKQEAAFEELQEEAEKQDVTVIRTPAGIALAPVRDGEVIPPDEFDQLPDEERETAEETIEELQGRFEEALRNVPKWERNRRKKLEALNEEVTEFAVGDLFEELRGRYEDEDDVLEYLEDVQADVIERASDIMQAVRMEQQPQMAQQMAQQMQAQQGGGGGPAAPGMGQDSGDASPIFRRYKVNVLVDNGEQEGAPVVYEDHPTLENLVGQVEYVAQFGALMTDFNLIRDGALHRANGGYLVLDARKLLMNRLSWEQLKRALFSNEIRIESTRQILGMARTVSVEPEPIPLDVKIVLIGERRLYYLLSHLDPEFSELYKVSVDFEEQMGREEGIHDAYPALLASYIDEEELRPFDETGVAQVMEHAVRMAGDREKLTTHSESVKDLLREADYWAGKEDREVVTDADVRQALQAQKHRKGRIRDRMQEQIERETILIDTDGDHVGQINGLSVLKLDDFSFGKPSRITARVRMGKGEVTDIEREVDLGGPLHSKGVMILQGLLGARYAREKPLALSASLVFEQNYGGVDGDSATLAETLALLSELAEVPVRQDIALTGSLNQHGQVQAIGGVNDKIEGFFETCKRKGLTGEQGVMVPQSNVKNLMLDEEVVQAVQEGQFNIWAVETLDEAIELLTGMPAGERDDTGAYPEESFNARVDDRLEELAEKAKQFKEETGGDDD